MFMKDTSKIERIGNIYGFTGGSFAGMVYGVNGCAPALNTMGGGDGNLSFSNPNQHDSRRMRIHNQNRLRAPRLPQRNDTRGRVLSSDRSFRNLC